MAENIDSRLESARKAALADPQRLGGEFALLLTEQGLQKLRSGRWDAAIQLLDEAQAFVRRASGEQVPAGTKRVAVPAGTKSLDPDLSVRGLSDLANATLRKIVDLLPSSHPLAPFAKSRLSSRLLQHGTTLPLDRQAIDEAVRLSSGASSEVPVPDAELLTNVGNALRARFELTGDIADIDGAIDHLSQAGLAPRAADAGDLHVILADLGDALLARYEATGVVADLNAAVDRLQWAVRLTPPGHPNSSAVLSNLGAALLSRFGHSAAVRDLNEAIPNLREAWQAGGGRQDVVRSNLGSALLRRHEITGDRADLDESLDHLTVASRAAPSGSPEQTAALSVLAEAMSLDGRLSAARDLLSEVVREREATLGADHPSTLAGRHNLATVMARLGHCQSAAEEFREVLQARERTLGVRHPDTLASRHNLATALADLNRDEEAVAEFDAVVRARTAVLGPNHPDTRASLAALEEIRRR
jgi:tetratricopeptide (TPR) repeat protein